MSCLEAKSFVLFYDNNLKNLERELAAFQYEHNIKFKVALSQIVLFLPKL